MRYLLLLAFAMLLSGGAVLSAAKPALAAGTPLNVCNQTSTNISIAVGYFSSGPNDTNTELTGPFVSTGWWVISAGQCQNGIANPFAARYMYWWGFYDGGADHLWNDDTTDYHFCIPNIHSNSATIPGFTLEDENANEGACVNAAAADPFGANQWITAREVDMDVNPTVYFNGY